MRPATHNITLLIVAMTALLLAACGGGSGDGDSFIEVPTAPSAAVSINADNAELISADVLYTAGFFGGFVLMGSPLPGVQIDATGSNFNYPEFVMQQLQQLSTQSITSNDATVSGIVISDVPRTYNCALSGTFRVYGNVAEGAPNWIPAEGDQITITYNDCQELPGIDLNGTMSITITALVTALDLINDPTLMETLMELRVIMTVLSVGIGGEAYNADGDMQMVFRELESPDTKLKLSGSELTLWGGGEVETLKGYAYDVFEEYTGIDPDNPDNPENYKYRYSMEGTLDSTVIGGSVSFHMTDPVVEFQGDGIPFVLYPDYYPFAGDLSITTNADTTNLKVSVQDINSVSVELYTGDTPIGDVTPTPSWKHLEQCLLDPGVCYGL